MSERISHPDDAARFPGGVLKDTPLSKLLALEERSLSLALSDPDSNGLGTPIATPARRLADPKARQGLFFLYVYDPLYRCCFSTIDAATLSGSTDALQAVFRSDATVWNELLNDFAELLPTGKPPPIISTFFTARERDEFRDSFLKLQVDNLANVSILDLIRAQRFPEKRPIDVTETLRFRCQTALETSLLCLWMDPEGGLETARKLVSLCGSEDKSDRLRTEFEQIEQWTRRRFHKIEIPLTLPGTLLAKATVLFESDSASDSKTKRKLQLVEKQLRSNLTSFVGALRILQSMRAADQLKHISSEGAENHVFVERAVQCVIGRCPQEGDEVRTASVRIDNIEYGVKTAPHNTFNDSGDGLYEQYERLILWQLDVLSMKKVESAAKATSSLRERLEGLFREWAASSHTMARPRGKGQVTTFALSTYLYQHLVESGLVDLQEDSFQLVVKADKFKKYADLLTKHKADHDGKSIFIYEQAKCSQFFQEPVKVTHATFVTKLDPSPTQVLCLNSTTSLFFPDVVNFFRDDLSVELSTTAESHVLYFRRLGA